MSRKDGRWVHNKYWGDKRGQIFFIPENETEEKQSWYKKAKGQHKGDDTCVQLQDFEVCFNNVRFRGLQDE